MQKESGARYAAAGVQATPGIWMTVRSHVSVPDSEAGDENYQEPYVPAAPRRPKREVTISRYVAWVFLMFVFSAVFFACADRCAAQKELLNQISAGESHIAMLEKDMQELSVQVAQARDSARISYAAVQRLGMIGASEADTIVVPAPDTRPYQTNVIPTENSPFSAGHGTVSGSR